MHNHMFMIWLDEGMGVAGLSASAFLSPDMKISLRQEIGSGLLAVLNK